MKINSKKLTAEIQRQKLNQAELGKVAGVSRQTINGICKGRECSESTAYKIAEALNVPLYELLGARGR